MAESERSSRNSWLIWLLVIIIIILGELFVAQYQENQDAQNVFGSQTAEAANQQAISLKATASIENKIKGCVGVNGASSWAGLSRCVIGHIVKTENVQNSDQIPTYKAYFSFMPDTFSTIGDLDLVGYTGRCVVVYGEIQAYHGTPYMVVMDNAENEPIQELADDVCSRYQ
jgi:hypothetical protein